MTYSNNISSILTRTKKHQIPSVCFPMHCVCNMYLGLSLPLKVEFRAIFFQGIQSDLEKGWNHKRKVLLGKLSDKA